LFVGEENTAIYRYSAEPTDGTTAADRVTVDTVETLGGHLVADVEGLALFQTTSGAGYLLASSQGNSEFVIYDRQTLAHLGSFDLRAVSGFVSRTDGIDVLSTGLGTQFPNGIFVAQHDDQYTLTRWEEVVTQAAGAGIALTSDSSFDPRSESVVNLADLDLDGEVNGLDVDPFVDVLLSGLYQQEADMNVDGEVNGLDVDPFVAAVVGGTQPVPEPSALLLAIIALSITGALRKWGV
jgi:hypothetical protein